MGLRSVAGGGALARDGGMRLRALIFKTAANLPQIGQLKETLRWGQPAYRTLDTKAAGFALFDDHTQIDPVRHVWLTRQGLTYCFGAAKGVL